MAEHHNILTQVDHSRPRQPDKICAKCRREFQPNDRISVAYIMLRAGADPLNVSRQGLYLSKEFEFVHVDCTNPQLSQGL